MDKRGHERSDVDGKLFAAFGLVVQDGKDETRQIFIHGVFV
jgi:hypothetical protein